MTATRPLPGNVVEADLPLPADLPPGSVRVNGLTVPWFRAADGAARLRVRATVEAQRVADADGRELLTVAGQEPADDGSASAVHTRPGHAYLSTNSGEPFLWLGDTWWYGLSERITNEELGALIERRQRQGFSVVHLVAGLYPETQHATPDAATDGRWSWTEDAGRLDPQWWDAADRRVEAIVAGGLLPAIVGAWSYYLLDFGPERMRTHWREIVARWAAYPGIWVGAGEAGLPHYEDVGSPREGELVARLTSGWRQIMRYIKEIDPYPRPATLHPCPAFDHWSSTDILGDRDDLDLSWLQTGHGDRASVATTLETMRRELATEPTIPVINSEVCYDGIIGGSNATLQRYLAWSQLLAGAAGHSYGAQGLWAFRTATAGPGFKWGEATWKEAVELPGGRQVGLIRSLLADVPWPELDAARWVFTPAESDDDPFLAHAAAGRDHRVIYLPSMSLMSEPPGLWSPWSEAVLHGLGESSWQVAIRNPRTGDVARSYLAKPDANGDWALPVDAIPTMEDWLIVASREA